MKQVILGMFNISPEAISLYMNRKGIEIRRVSNVWHSFKTEGGKDIKTSRAVALYGSDGKEYSVNTLSREDEDLIQILIEGGVEEIFFDVEKYTKKPSLYSSDCFGDIPKEKYAFILNIEESDWVHCDIQNYFFSCCEDFIIAESLLYDRLRMATEIVSTQALSAEMEDRKQKLAYNANVSLTMETFLTNQHMKNAKNN